MPARLKTLQRLTSLYAVMEEMHSTELQRLTAAVGEVQQAIGAERDMVRLVQMDGRGALSEGDRAGWLMTETQKEAAAWRMRGLEQIRLRREELSEAAKEQFVAIRLKREQMKRVCDDIAAGAEVENERRIRTASDDRSLARRRWTDARDGARTDQR